MENAVLTVVARNESGKKARREGFIPGVLYGKDFESMAVKFEAAELRKVVQNHGTRSRVQLMINNKLKMGLMKDLDKDQLANRILHVDFQIIDAHTVTKISLPIVYHGRSNLEASRKMLQINVSEIELVCESQYLPESLEADVSQLKVGDHVTVADLKLPPEVKPSMEADAILATITALQEFTMEDEEDTETTEAIGPYDEAPQPELIEE